MHPFELVLIPQCSRIFHLQEGINEFYNVHHDVIAPIMSWLIKMAADVCLLFWILGLYGIKMCLHSIHTSELSLADILSLTFLASDRVY